MYIYKKMYLRLFNAVTDALDALANGEPVKARYLLENAQKETEELYLSASEDGGA